MIVEERNVKLSEIKLGPASSSAAGREEGADVVIHPFTAHSYQNRTLNTRQPPLTKQPGNPTDRIFVADLDKIGPLFLQDFPQLLPERRQIGVWKKQSIASIKDRRPGRLDMVDSAEFADFLDLVLFARHDDPDLATAAASAFKHCAIESVDAARSSVPGISDVQSLDWHF